MDEQAQACKHAMPPMDWVVAIEQIAFKADHQAARIQLDNFRRQALSHSSLIHDIKLEIDRRCEQAVIDIIYEAFPDHGILAEERGWLPGSGEAFWIIDSLDGTVNFWHGLQQHWVGPSYPTKING